MTMRVLVIGGYGNFGRFICERLAAENDMAITIAGRHPERAARLATELASANPVAHIELDIHRNLDNVLRQVRPEIVIHTSGPYQDQGYFVAEACIAAGCHYLDLADAREFVAGMESLDGPAKEAGVIVISGASSVPALTSAVIDQYADEFDPLETVDAAITSAQLTNQGLATTRAILSYVGKPFGMLLGGREARVFGWQGLRLRRFWGLNRRFVSYCNVPDLALFRERYPTLQSYEFRAGIESKLQHLGLYLLSWLVRAGLIPSLQPASRLLLRLSRAFDIIGTNDSGFYLRMRGRGREAGAGSLLFEIVAREGDGLYIPCIPVIVLAKKIARGEISEVGAYPCLGCLTLDEYLGALEGLRVEWRVLRGED